MKHEFSRYFYDVTTDRMYAIETRKVRGVSDPYYFIYTTNYDNLVELKESDVIWHLTFQEIPVDNRLDFETTNLKKIKEEIESYKMLMELNK